MINEAFVGYLLVLFFPHPHSHPLLVLPFLPYLSLCNLTPHSIHLLPQAAPIYSPPSPYRNNTPSYMYRPSAFHSVLSFSNHSF